VLAGRAAAELKAERLAAAARDGATGPAGRPAAGDGTGPADRGRGAVKTTGGIKKDASTRAQGARRQARRDAR